jgi:chemotaxis protein CheD
MHAATSSDIGPVKARPGQHLTLFAGQLYMGQQAASVRTLLGSCVAVVLWHPLRRIGGMCHFLLPSRRRVAGQPRDARYGDEALELMLEALLHAGTHPSEWEAHLYGGADTMPDATGVKFNVGERNIEQGWTLIDHYGFVLQAVDVGDHVPRHVGLSLSDGSVQMRRAPSTRPEVAGQPI